MKNNFTKLVWPSSVILIFFVIDRILKNLFLEKLSSKRISIFGDWFGFAFQKNEGISYSIPLNGWLVIVITSVIIFVLVFIIIRIVRKKEWNYYSPLLLIILGAFSNLLDRLRYEYVVDMVNIGQWLTFNIADLMILVGALWLIIVYLSRNKLTNNKNIDSLN